MSYIPDKPAQMRTDGTVVNPADGINTDGSCNMQLTGSKFQDLGATVNATNMAAGAIVYGNWIDNVQWVRNFIILAQSDQQYDALIVRRDTSLQADQSVPFITGQAATSGGSFRPHLVTASNALLGYSAKFGIKNSAAVPNTFGILRVQLLGM